jgi:5-methylcytosine-specific restriction endonuclease McrA
MTKPKVEKKCTKCGEIKKLNLFPPDKEFLDGRSSWCRKCTNEAGRKWRSENPGYENNRDQEKRKEYQRNYQKQNRERENKRQKEPKYYKRKLHLNARRRAKKQNAEGSHTLGEWELLKKQYGFTCLACGDKEPNIVLTEDHIIPISKGGSDYIENIQPLCKVCNSQKHTKVKSYV